MHSCIPCVTLTTLMCPLPSVPCPLMYKTVLCLPADIRYDKKYCCYLSVLSTIYVYAFAIQYQCGVYGCNLHPFPRTLLTYDTIRSTLWLYIIAVRLEMHMAEVQWI